jgi:hypothetical protein
VASFLWDHAESSGTLIPVRKEHVTSNLLEDLDRKSLNLNYREGRVPW